MIKDFCYEVVGEGFYRIQLTPKPPILKSLKTVAGIVYPQGKVTLRHPATAGRFAIRKWHYFNVLFYGDCNRHSVMFQ